MKRPKRAWRPGLDDVRYKQNRELLKKIGNHICHLCGFEIDMQLTSPHPLSWSCDHATPRHHLHPDDPRNWQLTALREAHRRCNTARGTKPLKITIHEPIRPSIEW